MCNLITGHYGKHLYDLKKIGPMDHEILTNDKTVLGPWVAHLRLTVYNGIGKHSSSRSPAMNFDRSAETSLRLYMDYTDKINMM